MKQTIGIAAVVLMALCLGGCGPSAQTYHVMVTNRMSLPITVWLTKLHQPYPPGWEPPEVILTEQPQDQPIAGHMLNRGETADATASAAMEPDNSAVIRVYLSVKGLQIREMDQPGPNRIDIPIPAGTTDIDIVQEGDRMVWHPHSQATPTTAP